MYRFSSVALAVCLLAGLSVGAALARAAARPADAEGDRLARPTCARLDLPDREVDTGHDTGQ